MILYIDTTDYNKIIFGLSSFPLGKIRKQLFKLKPNESFKTIAKLEAFLKKHKITPLPNPCLPDRQAPHKGEGNGVLVTKIVVNKGPGSYTGVRVGATIAQALGFAWNIPVKFLSKDKFVI